MRGLYRSCIVLGIALAMVFASASAADASFKLRITAAVDGIYDNGNDIEFTWTDQSLLPLPPDANPIPGMVSTGPAFLVGGFLINVDGISKPFGLNDAYHANLHLHALSVTNTGATGGKIRIVLSDTDYDIAAVPFAYIRSSIGGTTNSSANTVDVAHQSIKLGAGDATLFAGGGKAGDPVADFTIVNAPPVLSGGFSDTKSGDFAYGGGPFSITERVDLSMTVGGIISLDYDTLVITPEPASVVLVGTGVLTLLGFRLRRRKVVVV